MQHVAWDDLRLLLAVAHGRSYARAARHLGIDDTTVSRRLRGLERSIGHPLVGRRPDGSAALTPLGMEIARRAERMEAAAREIEEAVGRDRSSPTGAVRLTAVPVIVNRLLVPKLARLAEAAPMVTVEFVPEARDLSLTRREADLALRLARPAAGGTRVLARRIGSLAYDGYIAAATDRDEEGALAGPGSARGSGGPDHRARCGDDDRGGRTRAWARAAAPGDRRGGRAPSPCNGASLPGTRPRGLAVVAPRTASPGVHAGSDGVAQ